MGKATVPRQSKKDNKYDHTIKKKKFYKPKPKAVCSN